MINFEKAVADTAPVDISAAIGTCTDAELGALFEWTERMSISVQSGAVAVFEAMALAIHREQVLRDIRKAADKMACECIEAVSAEPLEVADLTGIPPWSEASGV
jgi:hypothetical protein